MWYLVDNIALKWTINGGWGIFWGEIFRKSSTISSYLCYKIPTPQSQLLHFTKYIHILYLQKMHKLVQLIFCIGFPWKRYIPAWTHEFISHSSVAKQQQSILCMVLYIAYSDAGQFIACMCQIPLVYVSLFLTDPRIWALTRENLIFGGLRTTKAHTSLCIRAVWSAHLLSLFGKYHIQTCYERNFNLSG